MNGRDIGQRLLNEEREAQNTLEVARRRVRKAREATTEGEKLMNMALAIGHFEKLDELMSKGGALPSDWRGPVRESESDRRKRIAGQHTTGYDKLD